MLHTFKLSKQRGNIVKPLFRRAEQLKDAKDIPPFYIRGIKAASKEEYWASLALERFTKTNGLQWEYQVPVFGGRQISGGSVVDFICYTPGQDTWLDPMGSYWHTGKNEDRFQMAEAARRKHAKLIAWLTKDTPTKEIMYSFLKNSLNM